MIHSKWDASKRRRSKWERAQGKWEWVEAGSGLSGKRAQAKRESQVTFLGSKMIHSCHNESLGPCYTLHLYVPPYRSART